MIPTKRPNERAESASMPMSTRNPSTNSLGSNGTTMESASSSKNATTGFNLTSTHIRSILMHPMGLPLTIYMNDATIPDHPEYVGTVLNNFDSREDHSIEATNNVFTATALQWSDGKEVTFTKTLLENINSYKIGEHLLTTGGEAAFNRQFRSNKTGKVLKGKVDLIFHEKVKNDDKYSVVAIAEFGLDHGSWWAKFHQNLIYANIIRTNPNDNEYKIDHPILLPVIIINATTYDHSNTAGKKTVDIPFDATFGLFLCTPKGGNDYRLALLWRTHTQNLYDASMAFGKILNAIQLCAVMRNDPDFSQNRMGYKYLGPHCCKVQDLLYRAYDDRFRFTDRRPNMYFAPALFDHTHIAKNVLQITDELYSNDQHRDDIPPTQDAGDFQQEIDRLWMFKGKLLVISAPFHVGLHYATNPHHFFPIIDHLVQLHSQGFVHGDIRGYNMVFGTNPETTQPEGWLIDFDYGGKHNEVLYPKGYVDILVDGMRPGKQNQKITIMDDWKSLIGLILTKYVKVKKEGVSLSTDEESLIYRLGQTLSDYNESDHDDTNGADYHYPANLLRKYLTALGKVSLKPEYHFKSNLQTYGLWLSSGASTVADATHGATGSLNISLYNHA